MKPNTTKVLIHGFYGAGNLGDDAILEAVVDQLQGLPNVSPVTVSVYGNKAAYSGSHLVKLVPGRDPDRLYEAVREADVLLIGGGGLLQDYHGFRLLDLLQKPLFSAAKRSALGYYGLPLVMARILGRRTMLYAVGVGPFGSPEAANTAGWLAQSVSAVTVRDQTSAQLLRQLGVPDAVVTADPAVSLTPPQAVDTCAVLHGVKQRFSGRPLVGINLRPWSFDEGVCSAASRLALDTANWLVQRKDAGIVLLPLNRSGGEISLARELERTLPAGAATIAAGIRTPAAMLALCRGLDLVIGMRLHASVLCMAAGTPAVGLAYDPKVPAFFAEVGLSELCLDAGEAASEMLQSLAEDILNEPETWRCRVNTGMETLRDRERGNLRVLSQVMGAGPVARE